MKTDGIFYRLFQSFPSIFFELINQPPQLAEAYQFSSVEVKQLAFRIDGVFLPQTDAPELPIYFAVSEACRRMRHSSISTRYKILFSFLCRNL